MKEIFKWDKYSDQPKVIKDKEYKSNMRKKYIFDYIKMFLSSLFILPLSIFLMKLFRKKSTKADIDFYGLGVNLDKGEQQQELVEELGVKNLLLRVPLWDMENIDSYVKFAKSFKLKSPKKFLINIMQDREHIENHTLLKEHLDIIFFKFKDISEEFQVATTINRAKWGFFSVVEYLEFYKVAYDLKNERYKSIKLLGPSVIDFEYYYNARALFNNYDLKYDKISSLLYVDRRGSPFNTQYLFFDTKNKIDLLYSMVRLSPKCSDEIYITEANWPLSGTAPYAPTSQKECVSCEEYSKYMVEYHNIAQNSAKIKRVYWHQLIAPGYGLVDNRAGKIVRLPQFYEYKKMINGN